MVVGLCSIIFGFISDAERTWANLLVNNFFFLAIALAGTFFLAIQYVSQAGWPVAIKRIPEAMSTYLPYAAVLTIIIFVFGHHSIYHWTHHDLIDPNSEHFDPIIAGKHKYLNIPFYMVRMIFCLGVWVLFSFLLRKNSLLADNAPIGDNSYFKKNFRLSAIFLVLFAITSSVSAWDWLMSIDVHWFSTLFGWYVFSGLFISGIVVITLLVLYLKQNGYLEEINENHLHDLGKYIFGFSIFWAYLWFSQFMLIWYSNIPEEAIYFVERIQNHKTLFLGMLFVNFVVPTLILMTRGSKRQAEILLIIGGILLVGHWIDVYLMVIPGVLGVSKIGIIEIGTPIGFVGLFVFIVLSNLAKVALVPKNHPLLEESLHHSI